MTLRDELEAEAQRNAILADEVGRLRGECESLRSTLRSVLTAQKYGADAGKLWNESQRHLLDALAIQFGPTTLND